ncbi:protein of unknown function [Cyanobium sp. NIES-981]|nr:protein of unknown function [Cyanobium sp. NIES-981]
MPRYLGKCRMHYVYVLSSWRTAHYRHQGK